MTSYSKVNPNLIDVINCTMIKISVLKSTNYPSSHMVAASLHVTALCAIDFMACSGKSNTLWARSIHQSQLS